MGETIVVMEERQELSSLDKNVGKPWNAHKGRVRTSLSVCVCSGHMRQQEKYVGKTIVVMDERQELSSLDKNVGKTIERAQRARTSKFVCECMQWTRATTGKVRGQNHRSDGRTIKLTVSR